MMNRCLLLSLCLCTLALNTAMAAPVTYDVMVDTSTIAGTTGYLNFQFAPGGGITDPATVNIFDVIFDGTLAAPPDLSGGASGSLPGVVSINNSTVFNDYFQAVTFGSTLRFLLDLTGPALSAPSGTATSGSSFGLAFWDASGVLPLLTSDPNGFALVIDVNVAGQTAVQSFSTVPISAAEVPEPYSPLLIAAALWGLALVRRRVGSSGAADLHRRRIERS